MKSIYLIIFLFFVSHQSIAQSDTSVVNPYTVHLKKDLPITIGAIGVTALGAHLIANKSALTLDELNNKKKEDINFFDKGNAGFYSAKADKDSYIPFQASFTFPIIFLLVNNNERHHAGDVLLLYTETMAITGAIYTMSAGNVVRSRPLVYGSSAPLDVKLSKNSQRSFFAGHTAATAAASFFTAKVFADYNPDSPLRTFVWIGAAAVPAVVGYLRYKAGMHFLSDNIVGYVVGASCGILVPKFHHSSAFKNLTVMPQIGKDFKGLAMSYALK